MRDLSVLAGLYPAIHVAPQRKRGRLGTKRDVMDSRVRVRHDELASVYVVQAPPEEPRA